jgi:hypothetical protein
MKSQSGTLAVLVLVLAAFSVAASSATGATSTIVAAGAPTTTLAADVVPALGSYTDLGPLASDQQLTVVIPLQHDNAAIAA